eukprot:2510773-Rhodomonas_salina.1
MNFSGTCTEKRDFAERDSECLGHAQREMGLCRRDSERFAVEAVVGFPSCPSYLLYDLPVLPGRSVTHHDRRTPSRTPKLGPRLP